MSYRDELDAARLRIEMLEAELARLRANVVQWAPEEVVELREALYSARLELARERRERGDRQTELEREREALQEELEQTRLTAERERAARALLETALREPGRWDAPPPQPQPIAQWTPEEVVELRRALYNARTEAARERREREASRGALAAARAAAAAEQHRREALEASLGRSQKDHSDFQRGVVAALQAQLQLAQSRAAELEHQVVAMRMLARTYEARHAQTIFRLASYEPVPVPATLSDTDVAAFRARYALDFLDLPEDARRERAQELLLRVAASIYDGRSFRETALDPAVTLLRVAGHPLEQHGKCRFASDRMEIEARADRIVLRIGQESWEIDAGAS